jgi:hypothetical protein
MSKNIETLIEVSYENRNRTTVFWRGILVAPVYLFFATITGSADTVAIAALFFLPTLLALVFRGIYPSYFLHINHALTEFEVRITSYLMLLTDDYPSIERNPKVAVIFPDVEGGKNLNRWLPLVKWLLAIPLYIVGIAYIIASGVVTFFAWIATWSTGRYPEWAASIVLGTIRFWNRVAGYALFMVTDEYPSFSLK